MDVEHWVCLECDMLTDNWRVCKRCGTKAVLVKFSPAPAVDWRQVAEQLADAGKELIAYRDRAGAINFQLEKADDYHRRIRDTLAAYERAIRAENPALADESEVEKTA